MKWFSADQGMEMVDQLSLALKTKGFENPIEPIISDLNEYRALFVKAKDADTKWHLEIDF